MAHVLLFLNCLSGPQRLLKSNNSLRNLDKTYLPTYLVMSCLIIALFFMKNTTMMN